jgi:dynactin complex subunit
MLFIFTENTELKAIMSKLSNVPEENIRYEKYLEKFT